LAPPPTAEFTSVNATSTNPLSPQEEPRDFDHDAPNSQQEEEKVQFGRLPTNTNSSFTLTQLSAHTQPSSQAVRSQVTYSTNQGEQQYYTTHPVDQ
jgi:hypothetical protein